MASNDGWESGLMVTVKSLDCVAAGSRWLRAWLRKRLVWPPAKVCHSRPRSVVRQRCGGGTQERMISTGGGEGVGTAASQPGGCVVRGEPREDRLAELVGERLALAEPEGAVGLAGR